MTKRPPSSKWGEYSLGNQLPGVPRGTVQQLETYVSLLFLWNEKTNLTGAKTPQDFIHHLLDCIQAKRVVPPKGSILDLGSGNGLPGLIWAILDPGRDVFLVEANQKKAAFLNRVASQLALRRITVLALPFQELSPDQVQGREPVWGVSRGTSSPQGLLQLLKGTSIPWRAWFVFSSPLNQNEYLTFGPKFGMKISSLSYPKDLENPTDTGILTMIEAQKGQ